MGLVLHFIVACAPTLEAIVINCVLQGVLEVFLRFIEVPLERFVSTRRHGVAKTALVFGSMKYKEYMAAKVLITSEAEYIGMFIARVLVYMFGSNADDPNRLLFEFGHTPGEDMGFSFFIAMLLQIAIEIGVDIVALTAEVRFHSLPLHDMWSRRSRKTSLFLLIFVLTSMSQWLRMFRKYGRGCPDGGWNVTALNSEYLGIDYSTWEGNLCTACPQSNMTEDLRYICFGNSADADGVSLLTLTNQS